MGVGFLDLVILIIHVLDDLLKLLILVNEVLDIPGKTFQVSQDLPLFFLEGVQLVLCSLGFFSEAVVLIHTIRDLLFDL